MNVRNLEPTFPSIAETGARDGDMVMCISSGEPQRFTGGVKYFVVVLCGVAQAYGNRPAIFDGKSPVQLSWRGFGCKWRLVGRGNES